MKFFIPLLGLLFLSAFSAQAQYIPNDIVDIHLEDSACEAVSLGDSVSISGLVYGVNIRPSGLQFTLIDNTGGMNIFSFAPSSYVVNQGDSITVEGVVDFYRGLTEVVPDSIILHGGGYTLRPRTVVGNLNEGTESQWITLEKFKIVDSLDWTGSGSYNVDVTNYVDTFSIRWDSDVPGATSAYPGDGWLNINGIGGQFDFSSPYCSGYQIFPMDSADVMVCPAPTICFTMDSSAYVETVGAVMVAVNINGPNPDTSWVDVAVVGGSATAGTDFTAAMMTLEFPAGVTSVNFPVTLIDDLDIEGDETIKLEVSNPVNGDILTCGGHIITITDDETSGIANLGLASQVNLFPNPTNDVFVIDTDLEVKNLSVLTLDGKTIIRQDELNAQATISLENYASGMYLVQLETKEGSVVLQIAKH